MPYYLLLLLFTLNSCSNSGNSDVQENLQTNTQAAAGTEADSSGIRKTGVIPYQPYWGYMLDKSKDDIGAFFDGELQKNANFGPNGNRKLATSEIWLPLPKEMEVRLEEIHFYDWQGVPSVPMKTTFILRDTWQRVPGPSFTGDKYDTWVEYKLPKALDVAYIVLEDASHIYPTEIKLIGSYTTYKPKPFVRKEIKLNDMLGINGYIWNFQSKRSPDPHKFKTASAFTHLRDYVDWEKIEPSEGIYTFSPTQKGGWKYDLVYEELNKQGIEVLACLKTVPAWAQEQFYPKDLKGSENAPAPWTNLPKPIKPEEPIASRLSGKEAKAAHEKALAQYQKDLKRYDADVAAIRLDPASYIKFAKAAFQFAARYGSNTKLDPTLVTPFAGNDDPKLDWTIQEKKIGMGLVRMMECNNETNAWWQGRKRYQTGREYAANLSAFYDGHMGKLGPNVGVKQADPNMLVAMGGIADNSPAYVQGIIDWCKEFRGYKPDGSVNLCFDIANFHGYTNNAGGQHSNAAWGLPPELAPNTKSAVSNFLQVMSEVGNDVPLYLTEVGFGVNEGSQRALATETRTQLQSQADWIIRNVLFYAREGVAKVYHYQMYDETSYTSNIRKGKKDNRTYAACGLLENEGYVRRLAADYIAQLGDAFGGYTYKETLKEDPIVDVYVKGENKMFAVVVPDMKSRKAEVALKLDTPFAHVYEFVDGAEKFKITKLPTNNGTLTLTATETPVFVAPAR